MSRDESLRCARARRGLTLIEVLVAVAILGVGAGAWASLAGQGIDAMRATHARETEFQRADNELVRASLWSRTQLEASVGVHRVAGLQIVVERASAALFAVAVADSTGAVLLSTSFYRREFSVALPR